MQFTKNQTLGEVVTRFPKAADVFQKHRIDYCCGGHRTLEEAVNELKVSSEELTTELERYYSEVDVNITDWTTAPLQDLVHHILQKHHAYLYEVLPVLSELTTKIVRVHGSHHPELVELYQYFHQLKTDMGLHLIQEETIQYPAIEVYTESGVLVDLKRAIDIIGDLSDDHTAVGDLLRKMREVTNDYALPSDACTTFQKTYLLLEDLEQNTFTHVHLENNILFERLRELAK